MAADVVRQLAGTMPDLAFEDRGEFELRGFPEPWRLVEVQWQVDEVDVRLFGPPEIRRSDTVVAVETRKALAILAYLAVERWSGLAGHARRSALVRVIAVAGPGGAAPHLVGVALGAPSRCRPCRSTHGGARWTARSSSTACGSATLVRRTRTRRLGPGHCDFSAGTSSMA